MSNTNLCFMEVIAIEKKTLEAVEKAFERFENRMEELCAGHTKQLSKWLDKGGGLQGALADIQ